MSHHPDSKSPYTGLVGDAAWQESMTRISFTGLQFTSTGASGAYKTSIRTGCIAVEVENLQNISHSGHILVSGNALQAVSTARRPRRHGLMALVHNPAAFAGLPWGNKRFGMRESDGRKCSLALDVLAATGTLVCFFGLFLRISGVMPSTPAPVAPAPCRCPDSHLSGLNV